MAHRSLTTTGDRLPVVPWVRESDRENSCPPYRCRCNQSNLHLTGSHLRSLLTSGRLWKDIGPHGFRLPGRFDQGLRSVCLWHSIIYKKIRYFKTPLNNTVIISKALSFLQDQLQCPFIKSRTLKITQSWRQTKEDFMSLLTIVLRSSTLEWFGLRRKLKRILGRTESLLVPIERTKGLVNNKNYTFLVLFVD